MFETGKALSEFPQFGQIGFGNNGARVCYHFSHDLTPGANNHAVPPSRTAGMFPRLRRGNHPAEIFDRAGPQ